MDVPPIIAWFFVALLCRSYDLLFTWLVTPSLKGERNPFVRWLGWGPWIFVSVIFCLAAAALAVDGYPQGFYILCAISLAAALWNFKVLFTIRRLISKYARK